MIEEEVLIMDSAVNISCVGKGFTILFHTGETIKLNGAMESMRWVYTV
jgi:hypothetical protein